MKKIFVKLLSENDFEAMETYLRTKMLEMGAKLFESIIANKEQKTELTAEESRRYTCKGYRNKQIQTIFGNIAINRKYYYDAENTKGYYPLDRILGIEDTGISMGIKKAASLLGLNEAYGASQLEIKVLMGISIDAKTIERVTKEIGKKAEIYMLGEDKKYPQGKSTIERLYICMDGTGIPMITGELQGRKGKLSKEARTREVKLGCCFTQLGTDALGLPIREEASTTYLGGIMSAEEFGKYLYREICARKLCGKRVQIIVISDGAAWIWNIVKEYFPHAIEIIDLFHAREYYWRVGRAFYAAGSKSLYGWIERRKCELDNGDVEKVIAAIERLIPHNNEQKEARHSALSYYENHKLRMRYAEFRKQNLFVGSGVLEAGCKSVIAKRLKQSGMHWSVKGANNVIALRCCLYSNQWEDFWEKAAAA